MSGSEKVQQYILMQVKEPEFDLAGSRMRHLLHGELASSRGIVLRIVGAHGRVRDLLRADGIEEKVGGLDRLLTH